MASPTNSPPRSPGPIAPPSHAQQYVAHRAYIASQEERYFAHHDVHSAVAYFRLAAAAFSDRPALQVAVSQPPSKASTSPAAFPVLTYDDLDKASNRVANWCLDHGDALGLVTASAAESAAPSAAALLLPNCVEHTLTWLGLAKLGFVIPCINTRLIGRALIHSLVTASATHLFVSHEYAERVDEAQLFEHVPTLKHVVWVRTSSAASPAGSSLFPLTEAANFAKAQALPAGDLVMDTRAVRDAAVSLEYIERVTLDDPLFYIYTSGTTGPSKAALFSHRRFIGAGITWCHPMQLTSEDKYYVTLPLYHGNGGVVAVSAAWQAGACVVLRRKFSVSNFWRDVHKYGCTATIYIGELWRFLVNQTPSSQEHDNPLRVVAGNGLSADLWNTVKTRFGIERIVEHYGMTEMPAGPYMNFYGEPGACGYIPPDVRRATDADVIIKFDVETGTSVRDADGFCVRVTDHSEPGEVIFRLAGPYRGYTSDEATQKRIYRDVFERGDAWFATGDLLRCDSRGYFYFVDRIGDTFRWKGENVSTGEVSEVLCAHGTIAEANVYGVQYPYRNGRAGMASIVASEPFEERHLVSLYEHLAQQLPEYARPLFLRIRSEENVKTSTLKFRKFLYQKQGFDPDVIAAHSPADALYYRDERQGKFVPLTPALYKTVCDKHFRV